MIIFSPGRRQDRRLATFQSATFGRRSPFSFSKSLVRRRWRLAWRDSSPAEASFVRRLGCESCCDWCWLRRHRLSSSVLTSLSLSLLLLLLVQLLRRLLIRSVLSTPSWRFGHDDLKRLIWLKCFVLLTATHPWVVFPEMLVYNYTSNEVLSCSSMISHLSVVLKCLNYFYLSTTKLISS